MDVALRLVIVLLLILLNAFFVASEFALVSIRKTRIDELVKKGNKTAVHVQKALSHLDTFISSTQLGITLASLALGWIGEPALAQFIEPLFHFLPSTSAAITSHTIAFIVAFTLITFSHIVIGELAPKSLALQRPEPLSLFLIAPLSLFTTIFKPFIILLNWAGNLVLLLIGIPVNKGNQTAYSEEEVKMILSQSAKKGIFEEYEVEMIYKVLRFADTPIEHIMIPRQDIIAFKNSSTIKAIIEEMEELNQSRFPVYESSLDSIIGFLHIKDLYRIIDTQKEKETLAQSNIIRDILFVPTIKPADEVLYLMRKKKIHIAVVTDERERTAGIVTLEDIIERIIGNIEDEFDYTTKEIEELKDGSYIVSGLYSIDKLKRKFNFPLKGQGYTSVGALVASLLGRTPKRGDIIEIGNIKMKVAEVEGKRVSYLYVTVKK